MDAFNLVGQVLDQRFRLEGFARDEPTWLVYRARDERGAPVAIKCSKLFAAPRIERIHARLAAELPVVARLAGGARGLCASLACGLAHAPKVPHPILFVAQPWLPGVTLAEDLRQRRLAKRAPRGWAELRALFADGASALGALHGSGLVHLDVSPESLFLEGGAEGRLRVLDVGLAAAFEQEAASSEEVQTQVGSRAPHYLAPESIDARFGPTGPWTDAYAFALVLLEAASGQRARTGKGYADVALDLLERRRVPTPRSLGMRVPDPIEDFFATALALEARTSA